MRGDKLAWFSLATIAVGAGIAIALGRRKATAPAPSSSPPVRPPPPVDVPIPEGWTRYLGTVTPAMTTLANQVLAEQRPLGDVQTSVVDGKTVGAFTELHWDDHVDNEWKWHPGVSILVKDANA